MDGSEIDFADLLVEDQNNGAMSYLDCRSRFIVLGSFWLIRPTDLCVVHKQISTVVCRALVLLASPTADRDCTADDWSVVVRIEWFSRIDMVKPISRRQRATASRREDAMVTRGL
jgi:hypothetical protein